MLPFLVHFMGRKKAWSTLFLVPLRGQNKNSRQASPTFSFGSPPPPPPPPPLSPLPLHGITRAGARPGQTFMRGALRMEHPLSYCLRQRVLFINVEFAMLASQWYQQFQLKEKMNQDSLVWKAFDLDMVANIRMKHLPNWEALRTKQDKTKPKRTADKKLDTLASQALNSWFKTFAFLLSGCIRLTWRGLMNLAFRMRRRAGKKSRTKIDSQTSY